MDFEKEKIEEYSVFVALCRRPGSDEVSCFLTIQTRCICILSLLSLPKISRQPLRRGSTEQHLRSSANEAQPSAMECV